MSSETFTGGLRVGQSYWEALNLSYPLAKLSLIDNQLVVTGVSIGKITLKCDQITEVREYRGLISDGVQIQHSSRNQQPFIVFWISPKAVAPAFQKFGFTLQPFIDNGKVARIRLRFSLGRFVLFLIAFFFLVLMSEFIKGRDAPDVVLNATIFTLFAGIAGGILRRRLVR